MNGRLVAVWCFSGLVACSPILTPVTARQPSALIGQASAPRVIWLVDTSGSLEISVTPCAAAPTCGTPSNRCPPSCQTRLGLLQKGMRTLEAELPPSTQHALVRYPTDVLCAPPTSFEQNLTGADVISRVDAFIPQGGTPTAPALRFVAAVPPVPQAETFVVLITDGLPNCNASNPTNVCGGTPTAEALQACGCTTSVCTGALCSRGCMDSLGAVAASHQLAEAGLNLMVLGLGADLVSGTGQSFLSSMEITVARDCGAGACSEKHFMTENEAGFVAPAQRLARALRESERCTWWLPQLVTASSLSIQLGGETLDVSEWQLKGNAEQRVLINGAACERLLAGTEVPTFLSLAE